MSTREAKRSRASRVADCTRRLGHQDVPPCKHSVPHNSHAHPVFGLSKGDLSARMRASQKIVLKNDYIRPNGLVNDLSARMRASYQKIVFTSGADNESGTSCLFAKMMTMESCSLSSLRRSWSSPKHRRNKSAPIHPIGNTDEGGWRSEHGLAHGKTGRQTCTRIPFLAAPPQNARGPQAFLRVMPSTRRASRC